MNEFENPSPDKTVSLDATQAISSPVSERTQMAVGINCPVCSAANPPTEMYCIDCGFLLTAVPEAQEIIPEIIPAKLSSPDGIHEFILHSGENTVGRLNSDILITDGTVSRNHAVIIVENASVRVKDLGSTNGSWVGDVRIAQDQEIECTDGCEVRFGNVILKYTAAPVSETNPVEESLEETPEISETESTAETAEEQIEPAAPESIPQKLGTIRTKDSSIVIDIFKSISTVGRRDTNDIVINDPYCSGSHGKLEIQSGKACFTDTGSSNGSLVNGIRLNVGTPREILPGDELTIGRTVFIIELQEAL